jgi:hypothetical protein
LYAEYELVELWGEKYPICAFPAPPNEYRDLEAAIEGKPTKSDDLPTRTYFSDRWFEPARKRLHELNHRYDEISDSERRHFFPGPTYTLKRLWFDKAHAPKLDCGVGRYFASIATSEDCDRELMSALSGDPDRAVALKALELRDFLHETAANHDPVVDGTNRAAALSHATAVFVAQGNGYDLLLPFRSADVATHAYFRHVAPSGIFSPHKEDPIPPLEECSIERNFNREWVEELYAKVSHERADFFPTIDLVDEFEVSRLWDAIGEKRAELFYTGVSVNLLTLRPEICLALIIYDPTWLDEERALARQLGQPMKLGWEYIANPTKVREVSDSQGGHENLRIRLDAPEYIPTQSQRFDRSFLVPNAAAAISLGLTLVRSQHQP